MTRNELLPTNGTKVTLMDVMMDPGECMDNFGPMLWGCLFVAFSLWMLKLVSIIYQFFQYAEIRNFYKSALHIGFCFLINQVLLFPFVKMWNHL